MKKFFFRKPKRVSFQQTLNSSPKLNLPKFPKTLQNPNTKFSQLKKIRDNGKKEVSNFGFPSSFGEAGVDFPMFDLHR